MVHHYPLSSDQKQIKQDYCHHCNEPIDYYNNIVSVIYQEGVIPSKPQLCRSARHVFHAECFEEIAGTNQIPQLSPSPFSESIEKELKELKKEIMKQEHFEAVNKFQKELLQYAERAQKLSGLEPQKLEKKKS